MKKSYKPTGINNFHNSPSINLVISGKELEGMYVITASQQKRIEKHFCGITGCRCAGGACQQFDQDGKVWEIRKEWCK